MPHCLTPLRRPLFLEVLETLEGKAMALAGESLLRPRQWNRRRLPGPACADREAAVICSRLIARRCSGEVRPYRLLLDPGRPWRPLCDACAAYLRQQGLDLVEAPEWRATDAR